MSDRTEIFTPPLGYALSYNGNFTSFLIPSLRPYTRDQLILGLGDTDIFTVPVGFRGSLGVAATNVTGAAITILRKIKIGGIYYTLSSTPGVNVPTRAAGSGSGGDILCAPYTNTFWLEENEIFSFNPSGAGVKLFWQSWVCNKNEGIQSPRILALQNGNNTLYTCPAGKVSIINGVSTPTNPLTIANYSGGPRVYTLYVVKNGDVPNVNNQLLATFNLANNTSSQIGPSVVLTLAAGDSIVINSDSGAGTQTTALENILEIPA